MSDVYKAVEGIMHHNGASFFYLIGPGAFYLFDGKDILSGMDNNPKTLRNLTNIQDAELAALYANATYKKGVETEREACARVCENLDTYEPEIRQEFADAIRMRSKGITP